MKIIFGKPYITDKEINEVVDSLKKGWLGKGPKVDKFEKDFSKYTGFKYCVALNSCSAGLFLGLKSFGIGCGDEVITSPMTFAATVNAIVATGARPIFVDVKKNIGIIDENLIEQAITNKTKAILPIHYTGYPCVMDNILKIAKKFNLKIIEDAAHCIEGFYKGKKVGAIGDCGSFSFYATKNITTAEGGMFVTNNKKLADYVRLFSMQGISSDAWNRTKKQKYYDVVMQGFKYNMADINAAIGIHQLKKINEFYKIRLKQWKIYLEELGGSGLILPYLPEEKGTVHALHLFTILVDKKECGISRNELKNKLEEKGIGTGIHFISLHNHKYFKKNFGFKKNDFPNANYISDKTLSLPIGPSITEEEQEYVINVIRKILRN